MQVFSTEFPVSSKLDKANFIAQVTAWLQGAPTSTVLADGYRELDGSYADFTSHVSGERLTFRELKREGAGLVIGFRYDYPSEGLLWRTESVLFHPVAVGAQPLLRLKSQCLKKDVFSLPEKPKKPFLIKAILEDDLGAEDGRFKVSAKPYYFSDGKAVDLEVATAIMQGKATQYLPVVYVSAPALSGPALSPDSLRKLAYDLGGVAHVVVEPSRAFSSALLKKNPDIKRVPNGCVGLFIPQQGLLKKIFPDSFSEVGFRERIRYLAVAVCTQMPAKGWEWVDVQEASLKMHRMLEKSKLDTDEICALYDAELRAKDEQIEELKNLLASSSYSSSESIFSGGEILNSPSLISMVGLEMYQGEFVDRIRYGLRVALESAEARGVDKRSQYVFNKILSSTNFSSGLGELREELESASKAGKRSCEQMQKTLSKYGYFLKSDNKHVRMEPRNEFLGLESVTLPKTPSDFRSPKNMLSDTAAALGIKGLKD